MNARPKFYQRQFFIKKDFQAKFILLYLLSVLLVVGLSCWFLYARIQAAVEKHLYSTHMKVDQVGDFLANLLFSANLTSVMAIVLTVLVVSLLVFQQINRRFSRLDAAIMTMSEGEFTSTFTSARSFLDVGELTEEVEKTRLKCQARFASLANALRELEQGCESSDSKQLQAAEQQLADVLADIRLN